MSELELQDLLIPVGFYKVSNCCLIFFLSLIIHRFAIAIITIFFYIAVLLGNENV